MMLTSRRIWLGLSLCLLVLVSVLIPSLRNRVAQFSVRLAMGANVEFSRLNLHRSAQLVELHEFRTSVTKNQQAVQLQVDRVVFKVDLPNLLDKKLIAPRARLDKLNIQLTEVSLPVVGITTAEPWQVSLQALMDGLQWERIKQECDSLLAAEDILEELDGKIQRWLIRSQQIVLHATQLTQSIQMLANPLRERGEAFRQLQTLQELTREQAAFETQLPKLETMLTEKLAELQTTYDKDIDRLRKQVDRKGDAVRIAAAEHLALQWATQLWAQQACFGQATCMLLEDHSAAPSLDIDHRNLRSGRELVAISNIEATGSLACQSQIFDFAAKGKFVVEQNQSDRAQRHSHWDIDFKSGILNTTLSLVLGADGQQTDSQPEVLSQLTSKTLSTSSKVVFTADVVQSLERLNGSAKLNVAGMNELKSLSGGAVDHLQVLDVSTTDAEPLWVEFDISGSSYRDCRCTLRGPLPPQFVEKATSGVLKPLEEQRLTYEKQLESQISAKRDEIRGRIEKNAELAQQRFVEHRNSLAGMQTDLEKNSQYREGVANLPNGSAATR